MERQGQKRGLLLLTALAELDRLQQKRIELQSKELMKAIEKSGRSYEEILAFLSNSEEE